MKKLIALSTLLILMFSCGNVAASEENRSTHNASVSKSGSNCPLEAVINYTGTGLKDHATTGELKPYEVVVTNNQGNYSVNWSYKFDTYGSNGWTPVHGYVSGGTSTNFSKRFFYQETYGSITVRCTVTDSQGHTKTVYTYIEWDKHFGGDGPK